MDLGTVPNAAEKKFCFLHVIDEAVFGDTFRTLELHRFYHAACNLLSYHSKTMGLCPGTLPEFRGKGLAQELLRFSTAIAWTKWIRIFLVQTSIMNDGYTNICKSAGLHQVYQKRIYARVLG